MELTQKMRVTRSTLQVILIISAFMAIVLMIYSVCGVPGASAGKAQLFSYADDWNIQNGVSSKRISLPKSGELTGQGTLVLTNVIPSAVADSDVLCIVTNHQNLNVEVDGTLVYSYESPSGIGDFFGKTYHFIPLSSAMTEKQITLTFTTFSNVSRTYVEVPQIGTSGALYRWIMAENALALVSGVFFLLSGLALVVGAVVMYVKKMRQRCAPVLMMGLFFILSALGELYQTGLLSFIFANEGFVYLLGYTAQMMYLVPLLLYFMEELNFRHRFSALVSELLMMNFIVQMVIYVYGASDFANMEIVTLVLSMAVAVYFVYVMCMEYIKYQRHEIGLALIATSVLLLMMVVDAAFGFLLPDVSVRQFDSICIFLCRAVLAADVFRLLIGEFQEQLGVKLGSQLAFLDGLTHMANRSSYNRHVEQLANRVEQDSVVTVVDVRLNMAYLMDINIHSGYNAGDELVLNAAKCVDKTFKHIGECYRIAGNEFVVIIEQRTEEEVQAAVDTFCRTIVEYNQTYRRYLMMSIGYTSDSGVMTRDKIAEMARQAWEESKSVH